MGLSPNSLKKHKRQLKEKLIQKQIAFLSQKNSSSHRTATANPRHITVNVTLNENVNSKNSNKTNKVSSKEPNLKYAMKNLPNKALPSTRIAVGQSII